MRAPVCSKYFYLASPAIVLFTAFASQLVRRILRSIAVNSLLSHFSKSSSSSIPSSIQVIPDVHFAVPTCAVIYWLPIISKLCWPIPWHSPPPVFLLEVFLQCGVEIISQVKVLGRVSCDYCFTAVKNFVIVTPAHPEIPSRNWTIHAPKDMEKCGDLDPPTC